jgi:hypothetical protein
MDSQPINERDRHLCLKESSGWFAAGDSHRRALRTLSDGAFKLFAHLCLEANRRTGRYEAVQTELAKAIGKSRRIVGKYIEELQRKHVCTVRSASNQYSRTCFEICDEYWPYWRIEETTAPNSRSANAYVDAIKNSFIAIGCTTGRFSPRDAQIAQDLQNNGVPLETVQNALLIGAVRKYVSWLNGGSLEPIGSLAYFVTIVSETRDRPLAPDYQEYLERKAGQLKKAWQKESAKTIKNRGYLNMPCSEIVQ